MEDNADVPISTPIVFQCLRCRAIIGDSFSLICISEEQQLITLSSANNIQRDGDIFTSKTGDDVGSTFYRFSCKICNAGLGKYYLTTSKDLDQLREQFSFEISQVSSYQLGTTQIQNREVLEQEAEAPSPNSLSNFELTSEIYKVRIAVVAFLGMTGHSSYIMIIDAAGDHGVVGETRSSGSSWRTIVALPDSLQEVAALSHLVEK